MKATANVRFPPIADITASPDNGRMSEPGLQLFKVECRAGKAISTFFVPAHSPDEAIVQAMTTASKAQAQDPELADPFQEVGFEVRVGTYEAPGSTRIIFGEWSRLSN
jgi:hypothetical protein